MLCSWLLSTSILHACKCRTKGVSCELSYGGIAVSIAFSNWSNYNFNCNTLSFFMSTSLLLETLKIWTLDKHLMLKSREAKNAFKTFTLLTSTWCLKVAKSKNFNKVKKAKNIIKVNLPFETSISLFNPNWFTLFWSFRHNLCNWNNFQILNFLGGQGCRGWSCDQV